MRAITIGLALLGVYSLAGARELLVNPDFAVNTAGWAINWGDALSHNSAEGHLTANGSAQVDGHVDSFSGIFQCVDVSAQPSFSTYHVGASIKPVGPLVEPVGGVIIDYHSDPGCASAFDSRQIPLVPSEGVWSRLEGDFSPPSGALGFGVVVLTRGTPDQGVTLFDDVTLFANFAADGFEPDDTAQQANTQIPSGDNRHSFHSADDEDWIAVAAGGTVNFIVAPSEGIATTGITVELHERLPDGSISLVETLVSQPDDAYIDVLRALPLRFYFVRIAQCRNTSNPACTGSFPAGGAYYDVEIFGSVFIDNPGILIGRAVDGTSGGPVGLAFVETSSSRLAISDRDGTFGLADNQGTYTADVFADGYSPTMIQFELQPLMTTDVGDVELQDADWIFGSGFE